MTNMFQLSVLALSVVTLVFARDEELGILNGSSKAFGEIQGRSSLDRLVRLLNGG